MTTRTGSNEVQFSANTNIADALAHGPDIAEVFMRYRMYCIGCTFTRFESLRTAAVNHQVDVDEFVKALNNAVDKAAESGEGSQSSDPGRSFSEEV